MTERDEPDPFPEASVPESRESAVSPEALSTSRSGSGAPAVPPSEAPTLPLIPVDKLRFQPDAEASPSAPLAEPAASSVSTSAPAPAVPGITPAVPASVRPSPAVGEVALPVEQEALPPVSVSAPVPPVRRDLVDRREPLYRECQGYRLRLDPPDLARLRELAGSRGRSDEEIGETFFDGQAARLAESLAGDVPIPNEIRVIVDPYSRQAFLALENRIRGILSF